MAKSYWFVLIALLAVWTPTVSGFVLDSCSGDNMETPPSADKGEQQFRTISRGGTLVYI